ncbi:MAG: trypsin-like serine peptidase [Pseudobdellovibrionaceae bacterium]
MFCLRTASFSTFVVASVISLFAHAAVYGEDDRVEPFNVDAKEAELAKSVAGRFSKDHLTLTGDHYEVNRTTLGAEKCSSIRFAEQTLGPTCSGFLVSPNLLVTAAHCMTTDDKCTDNFWVFDYALKNAGDQSYRSVPAKNVYKCKQVVAKSYKNFGDVDYAIIQLDRPVTDRKVLQMDFNPNSPALDADTFTAGYPSGLPLKVTLNGKILKNSNPQSFDSDLDIFHGNSGGPVIDRKTGLVLGIVSLTNGDYERQSPTCKIPKVCLPHDNCYVTMASRVLNLKDDFNKLTGGH